jgi:hypothetical protein
MECPICLDTIKTTYCLKSCSHVICMKCYRAMAKEPDATSYPFMVETVKQVEIKCPLCRKQEDIPIHKENHPLEYMQFMELLLNTDEWGDSWCSVPIQSSYVVKRDLKYASTKVRRHRFKRIGRGGIY